MAFTDILGKTKEIRENELISPENIKVSVLNNGQVAASGLVGTLNLSYGQQVQPNYILGSSDVFFVSGRSSGQGTMESLVGTNGFFDMLDSAGSKCLMMNTIKVRIDSDCVTVTKGKTLTANGVKITGLSIGFSSQGLIVGQSIQFMVGSLSR